VQKNRAEAELQAVDERQKLRNKATAILLGQNMVLRKRLARWEGS